MVCMTCPMSKFTKLPFQYSTSVSTSAFELIHLDIWGPYRVPTRGIYRFFLTIVDDYTRATWVYLLSHESQAFTTIQTFMNFSQNRFDKFVKTICSNNALEFDTSPCNELFSSKDIVHQTSCIDRPQQNGIVERKYRHLLEVSRAIRFQSSLPLSF